MDKPLTTGEKIARDLCEMDAPPGDVIEVDPVDVARRIDSEMAELRQQLAAEQAYSAQLRDALKEIQKFAMETSVRVLNVAEIQNTATEAIAIPRDTTALQEYSAKMVERIADNFNSGNRIFLHEFADKIRKGEF